MYEYKREKFEYYGQDIIPATIGFNYALKEAPEYEYVVHEGAYFYTTYTDTDSSPIKLKDGSVIYSEARYVIHAPEDENWTIELDGDVNYEKYIIFPNGKKIDCEKAIIEPYWGKVKEVTTLDGKVLDYSELIENGYLPNP